MSEQVARHLLRAKDLVDARYFESLTVADMAAAATMSPSHFSRCFTATFGESPHQYLLTRRLERAAALLRTSDRPVIDICLWRRLEQRGFLHHQLCAGIRSHSRGVPCLLPTRCLLAQDPALRRTGLRTTAESHVSRSRRRGPPLGFLWTGSHEEDA